MLLGLSGCGESVGMEFFEHGQHALASDRSTFGRHDEATDDRRQAMGRAGIASLEEIVGSRRIRSETRVEDPSRLDRSQDTLERLAPPFGHAGTLRQHRNARQEDLTTIPLSDDAGTATVENRSVGMAERFLRALEVRGFKNIPDFARRTGIPASSLYEIKRGSFPKDERMAEIAEILGVSEGMLRYGPDEAFFAAIAHDPTAPDAPPPDEPAARGRTGELRTYRLTTVVQSPEGDVQGPVALELGAISEDTRELARRAAQEAGRRSGQSDARTVELAGVPRGAGLIDVRVPIIVREADQVVDYLGPGWVLVVEPGDRPARDDEDLVIAALEADMTADELIDHVRLFHYREDRGVGFLWPLDFNPRGVVNTRQGWKVVGRIVERRKV